MYLFSLSVFFLFQAEAARELLKRGANVEARDRSGRTPLMWAGLSLFFYSHIHI
jgi:hypothetical protein